MRRSLALAGLAALGLLLVGAPNLRAPAPHTSYPDDTPTPVVRTTLPVAVLDGDARPLPEYLHRSLGWLAEAQYENGGWGAGQHSAQNVRDPHAVQIDAATTAFAASALLRSGSTLRDGPYARNVSHALDYLLGLVEELPDDAQRLSSVMGTQPQAKLGQNVDAAMASQFFTRILPHTAHDRALKRRVERALDRTVDLIEGTQDANGSWSGSGWAGVLQSAMANSALEAAQAAGRRVDEQALERSRAYQAGNVTVSGSPAAPEAVMDASDGAGITLYSATSSQRASARQARKAREVLAEDMDLSLDEVVVTQEALEEAGVDRDEAEAMVEAYSRNEATSRLLEDDQVWTGFGNNGGEEFLSYMMTSESLVIDGGTEWDAWHDRLSGLFGQIQNENGSWSGHHCITSPVFSTAAVVLALTADRDADLQSGG